MPTLLIKLLSKKYVLSVRRGVVIWPFWSLPSSAVASIFLQFLPAAPLAEAMLTNFLQLVTALSMDWECATITFPWVLSFVWTSLINNDPNIKCASQVSWLDQKTGRGRHKAGFIFQCPGDWLPLDVVQLHKQVEYIQTASLADCQRVIKAERGEGWGWWVSYLILLYGNWFITKTNTNL